MKRILILVTIISSAAFLSCSNKVDEPNKVSGKSRIILKEDKIFSGAKYSIIEVDGVEYLCQNNGGICPLVK